ncbi:LacI family transcriptional regulator [Bombilactobacillus folatiphilus]|uniref:LacI family transcriptional regulator n=1 Tax=Bombilactobacillus folatiphilus TaxID=2923362 RepID=A0ABY4PAP7_9LACO|nr:LacI family DNA-binding transcriptional regulator [Bombilactobacillus folatiphilus]UQS82629.1 LacI family transcriptional regulator [Bombilactobacillus folatiphilus]
MTKKISIKDIAAISGVSPATVSRVINNNGRFSEQTRQKVTKVIEKYNYQTNTLAKGLRMQKSNTIGIIVPDLANTFFSALVEKIENQFFSKNYSTIICDSKRNITKEIAYIQMLEAKSVDGLIVISGQKMFDSSTLNRAVPVVCIDRKPSNKTDAFISSNHYQGAVIATQALLEAKTQPVLFKVHGQSSSINDRIQGFKDTLQQNLTTDSIIDISATNQAGSNERRLELRTQLRNLMGKQTLPLGIFAYSDTLAADLITAARDLNLSIPGDLKIIGFDDAPIAKYCYPELTTIHQDTSKIALAASQQLIDAMQNNRQTAANNTIINVHLVKRGTV